MPGEYDRLPRGVRAFLETSSEQDIVTWANCIRFYAELHDKTKHYLLGADEQKQPFILSEDGRKAIYGMIEFHAKLTPEARQFLVASDPSVFRWLLSMRAEEVELISTRTKQQLAFRLVGSFGKYAIIGLIAMIALGVKFGTELANLFSWFLPGGHK